MSSLYYEDIRDHLLNSFQIPPDRIISWCDVPEHKGMIMGNVNDSTVYDIFAGSKMARLRYQLKNYGGSSVFPCSVCDYTGLY